MTSAFHRLQTFALCLLPFALLVASVAAHEMVVKGTVAGIEAARIQVKTGEEKTGAQPEWYPIDAATKIRRGERDVTREQAAITPGERVVVIVDHPDKGPMKTKEIRLAARE
jgi:hypothetical protein